MKKVLLVLFLFSAVSRCALAEIISPANAFTGKCFTIKIVSAEGISEVKARFLGQEIACYERDDGSFKGVIGVPLEQKPGTYPLTLTFMRNGKSEQFEKRVK